LNLYSQYDGEAANPLKYEAALKRDYETYPELVEERKIYSSSSEVSEPRPSTELSSLSSRASSQGSARFFIAQKPFIEDTHPDFRLSKTEPAKHKTANGEE
jgi:hypothetical protein